VLATKGVLSELFIISMILSDRRTEDIQSVGSFTCRKIFVDRFNREGSSKSSHAPQAGRSFSAQHGRSNRGKPSTAGRYSNNYRNVQQTAAATSHQKQGTSRRAAARCAIRNVRLPVSYIL